MTKNPLNLQNDSSYSYRYVDLLIIDEMLPCDFSPFRSLEYSHYLSFFESSLLVTTEGWHSWASNLSFDEELKQSTLSRELKPKIRRFADFHRTVPALAYITFLHNAFSVFPLLKERNIPFILQAYPGGGFELNNEESDAKLRMLAQSPLCRKIITTQKLSRQYLLEKIGCHPSKVEFIYGGVYDTRSDFDFLRDKKLFGNHKRTIDICFVAHRYGDDVKKKGYDQLVAVARAVSQSHPHIRFHVVGDYTPDQLPLGPAAENTTFHGRQPKTFFADFYPNMDMILSVNRPAEGLQGAFDGFPTGACMEAGFRGVLNLISDPLGLNVAFTDGKDVVLLGEDTDRTVALIKGLASDPRHMYEMAYANWRKFRDVFDTDKQLWDRTKLITAQLLARETLIVRPPAAVGDPARAAALLDHNARLTEAVKDTERRHDNLLAEYYKLAAGFEELRTELAARDADELSAPEVISAPAPEPAPQPLSPFRNFALRAKRRLNRLLGE